jgi:hypothetical protein
MVLSCMKVLKYVNYSVAIVEDFVFLFSIITCCLRINPCSEAVQISVFNLISHNFLNRNDIFRNVRMEESVYSILDQSLESLKTHYTNEELIGLLLEFVSYVSSNCIHTSSTRIDAVLRDVKISFRLCSSVSNHSSRLFIPVLDVLVKEFRQISLRSIASSNDLLNDIAEILFQEQVSHDTYSKSYENLLTQFRFNLHFYLFM